jgi:hypothetical protein
MAKKYLVKVYDKSNNYVATWDEYVSSVSFQNEINTAGGQMRITLARNAGDYGEGTDINFGYRVKVYVFDLELPNGEIIFQGYISSYTPIYKDNNVEIIILSYGSELNDYIIEAGESLDQSQLVNTGYFIFGNFGALSNTEDLAQTITAVGNGRWNKLTTYMKTVDYYNNSTGLFEERLNKRCQLLIYTGSNPASLGTLLGTSDTVTIAGRTEQLASFTFASPVAYTNASVYTFVLQCIDYAGGSDQYMFAVRYGSGYTGGSLWQEV